MRALYNSVFENQNEIPIYLPALSELYINIDSELEDGGSKYFRNILNITLIHKV
jgi:hypothetical protein